MKTGDIVFVADHIYIQGRIATVLYVHPNQDIMEIRLDPKWQERYWYESNNLNPGPFYGKHEWINPACCMRIGYETR